MKPLPRLKPLKTKGIKYPKKKAYRPPSVSVRGVVDLVPPEIREIHRRMGNKPSDLKLAKRVLTLSQQIAGASIPELITYDWLKQKNIPFVYQAYLFGGRNAKGGIVPDFIITQGNTGIAWQVQGEYWHSYRINAGKDATTRIRLLGATFNGVRINEVVDLWEDDVYSKRPTVFTWAIAGIGLRN